MSTDTDLIAESETRGERFTRRLGRFLGRWGVDALQYHHLLQCSLKMDFRSTNPLMKGRSETKSALRQTAWMNLFFGGFMSILLAFTADAFFFTVLMIGYAMAMLAMMILMEFGLVVVSPDDYLILAHRPISSRTFFAVRFSNLMFYVLILSLSLNAAPTLLGTFCRDSRWFFPPVYLAVSTAAAVFTAGVVIALYGLFMRWVHYERLKDLLVYCQIVFSFLFFFGYQMVPRLAQTARATGIEQFTHGWGVLFPSVWFAGLLELGLGRWSWESLLTGGMALLMMALVMPWLFRAISLDYSEQVGRMMTASGKSVRTKRAGAAKETWTGWLTRLLCRDVEERAFFGFIVTMLRRNRQLKMQLYPNFGIMIAMLVLAVLDRKHLSDPFSGQGGGNMAISFSAMAFMFGGMGLAAILPYSDEYAGAWLFQTAPLAKAQMILKAVKKATVLFFFMPLLLLTILIFSFLWPVLHAVEFGLFGLLIGLTVLQLALLKFRGFPFSKKPEKGAQSGRFVLVMMISAFTLIFLFPLLLLGSQPVLIFVFAAMLLFNLLLGAWSNRRFAKRGFTPE
jgi:ABC-2 type transport system permease protein